MNLRYKNFSIFLRDYLLVKKIKSMQVNRSWIYRGNFRQNNREPNFERQICFEDFICKFWKKMQSNKIKISTVKSFMGT